MTTSEQMAGREQFRRAVVPALGERVRVVADAEGWPMVPGRQGRLEWRGVEDEIGPDRGTVRIYVHTPKARMITRLSAVPGVQRWQIGDDEGAFWVAAEDAEAIRACRRADRHEDAARGDGIAEELGGAGGGPRAAPRPGGVVKPHENTPEPTRDARPDGER